MFRILTKRTFIFSRAIFQVVSRWHFTVDVRVRSHVRFCGVDGEKSSTGVRSVLVRQFPAPIPLFTNCWTIMKHSVIDAKYCRY
jgi:hypothetical protein